MLTVEEIEQLFTSDDGNYKFARWSRPIAPIVFGVEDETLRTVKGAIEAVVALAGHQMAETDPELGSNLMIFFFREWNELLDVPNLDQLIPSLPILVSRLRSANATRYRAFRFEADGSIQAAFVFLRMTTEMCELPAENLALTEATQTILVWGEKVFLETSPLAIIPETGSVVLRPEIAGVIAAGYDPKMPVAADDRSHALRIFARLKWPAIR